MTTPPLLASAATAAHASPALTAQPAADTEASRPAGSAGLADAPDLCADFRRAMRRLAATVTILTTADGDGVPHGMVATAVTSVSMDPPTLLACVNRSASLHAPLLARRGFCVNVLATRHEGLVGAFSGQRSGAARFEQGPWRHDGFEGLPWLDDAQCVLRCEVQDIVSVGSHSVVLARVLAARSHEEIAPLLYVDGGLTALRGRSAQPA